MTLRRLTVSGTDLDTGIVLGVVTILSFLLGLFGMAQVMKRGGNKSTMGLKMFSGSLVVVGASPFQRRCPHSKEELIDKTSLAL